MPARKRTFQTDKTRQSIKAGMLIRRLTLCAAGKIQMQPTEVKAAQILLDRVLPILTSTDMSVTTEPQSPNEIYAQLQSLVGEDMAKQLAGHLLPKQDEVRLDS
jgi:hypothetical protein